MTLTRPKQLAKQEPKVQRDPLPSEKFSTPEKRCGWLLKFLRGCLQEGERLGFSESTMDFYTQEYHKALQWKKQLNAEGKVVYEVADF